MSNLNIVRVMLTLASTILSETIAGMSGNSEEKQSLVDIQYILAGLPTMVVDHIQAAEANEFTRGKSNKREGASQVEFAIQRMKDRRGV